MKVLNLSLLIVFLFVSFNLSGQKFSIYLNYDIVHVNLSDLEINTEIGIKVNFENQKVLFSWLESYSVENDVYQEVIDKDEFLNQINKHAEKFTYLIPDAKNDNTNEILNQIYVTGTENGTPCKFDLWQYNVSTKQLTFVRSIDYCN